MVPGVRLLVPELLVVWLPVGLLLVARPLLVRWLGRCWVSRRLVPRLVGRWGLLLRDCCLGALLVYFK